jgi:TetR/AcrR family transcriptional regulator, cholesterol catabolism regulator
MPVKKGKRRPQEKKEKIMQATMRLLLKKGSYAAATSTTDICKAARLTRPTLYHYFGSKRNLIFSVHMYSIETGLRPYVEKASAIEDPMERLTYMVRTFTTEIICKHPELRYLIHDTLSIRDKYFREVREEWKRHYLLLRNTIAELQSQGKVSGLIKASYAALFLLGMMTWITFWFEYDQKDEIEALGDAVVAFVMHGLGGLEHRSSGP